jgi:Protein of unknown function (DUF2752)
MGRHRKHGPEARSLSVVGTGLSVPFAATGAVLVAARSRVGFTLPCALRDHVGIPCPFCGVTRAASSLVQFDVAPHQVAAVAVVIAIAMMTTQCMIGWIRRRELPTPAVSAWYLVVVSVLLLTNWVVQLAQ